MTGGSKKKPLKLSWQEMQAQFGDKSRNPLDNLPTSSRSNSDHPRDSFRSSMYDRERRERREDREEAPSRADESNTWRSTTSSAGSSSFRNSERMGRSDDGMWRSSRPPASSSFSSYARRDDLPREPDSSGRPRLNLSRPSADRLAAAQEQQMAAKAALVDERPSMKPSPFGDAKPVTKMSQSSEVAKPATKLFPFGNAKPVEREKTAEPWRPRSFRPLESESRPEPSDRFARPVDTPPVRARDEPAVKLVPSLPPKKVAAPVVDVKPPVVAPVQARSPSPAKSAEREPEPPCPVRSALEVSMSEGTWVTADELADCIGQVSLNSDDALDAMGNVIALSLAHKTVLLPSAVTLIPKDHLPEVLRRSLVQLVQTLPAEEIDDIVGNVNVIEALNIDSSLNRDEMIQCLTEMGLQQFAPKENVAAAFKSLFDESVSNEQLLAELMKRFPRKSKVPVDVACVVGEFITRQAVSSGAFNQATLEQYHETLTFITATVKMQTHVLFGVQEAWFAHATGIKRSGKALFEALYEMRLISVDAMVAWMHDKERSNGKRKLLLQCGGYISDMQNSAIAHQFENSDSEDSVDLDSDFPQANRNYDDY